MVFSSVVRAAGALPKDAHSIQDALVCREDHPQDSASRVLFTRDRFIVAIGTPQIESRQLVRNEIPSGGSLRLHLFPFSSLERAPLTDLNSALDHLPDK